MDAPFIGWGAVLGESLSSPSVREPVETVSRVRGAVARGCHWDRRECKESVGFFSVPHLEGVSAEALSFTTADARQAVL